MFLRPCLVALAAFLLPALSQAQGATPELHLNWQYDVVDVDAPGAGSVDGWRRQRVALGFAPGERFEIRLEHDFTPERWVDAHLRIRTGAGTLLVGQFKQPFGLETMNSNRARLLMESAYHSAFGIEERLGLGWQHAAGPWNLAVGLFGQELTGDFAGEGITARGVFSPVATAEETLHLGLGLARERRDDPSFSLSTRPEASLTPLRLARTGTITDADTIDRVGLEAAWRRGPLLLQGEAGRMRVERSTASTLEIDGAYLTAAWLFTGETHAYKGGTFAAPSPAGRWGALEGVVRAGRIDIDQGLSDTDGQRTLTLGLNWYLTERIRFMANYVEAEQRGSAPALVDPSVLEVRIQLGF